MIKVKITHLKAPWPQGAKVGDVVALPSMPAWALGKCARLGDDAEATVAYQDAEAGQQKTDPAQQVRDEAAAYIEKLQVEHAEKLKDLELRMGEAWAAANKLNEEREAAIKSADALRAELAESQAQVEALRAQVAATQKPKGGK